MHAYIFDPDGDAPPNDPLIQQVLGGEWGILHEEAGTMTAEHFARMHGTQVNRWGRTGWYASVRVDGTDYLWEHESGKYDGWTREMIDPEDTMRST